jgi:hypothetical protein
MGRFRSACLEKAPNDSPASSISFGSYFFFRAARVCRCLVRTSGAPLSRGRSAPPPRCTSSCDLFIPILPHQGPFGSCFPLFLRDSILPVERPACTPVPLDCAPLGLIWPVSSPSLSSVSSAHSVLRCVRRRLENCPGRQGLPVQSVPLSSLSLCLACPIVQHS